MRLKCTFDTFGLLHTFFKFIPSRPKPPARVNTKGVDLTLEKMDEAFIKQRNEKGNAEIKKMAETHFKQREADEAKVKELEERIAKNKQVRNYSL